MNFYKRIYIIIGLFLFSGVCGYGEIYEPFSAPSFMPSVSQPFSSSASFRTSSFSARPRDAMFSRQFGAVAPSSSIYGSYWNSSSSAAHSPALYSTGGQKAKSAAISGLSGMSVSSATTSFRAMVSGRNVASNMGASAPKAVMYGMAPPPPPGGGSTNKENQLPLTDGIPVLLVCAGLYALVLLRKHKKNESCLMA